MKKIFASMIGTAVVVMSALSASATTSVRLQVLSGSFLPGSTVTLGTFVTSNGGETDNALFGAINQPVGGQLVAGSQVSLSTVGTASPGWILGFLTCTTAWCASFSQVNGVGPATAGLTDFQLATTSFVIDPLTAVGTVINFAWRTSPSTQRLDWFGVTNAPGVSITVVPEPATAALLVAGLLGLGLCSPRTRRFARATNASKVAVLSIIALAGVVGPSLSANATTSVRLVASGPFTPGSIITLQTFVTADGGETDNSILGNINYPDATVNSNVAGNSQVNLSTVTASPTWINGGLTCSSTLCTAFNQVNVGGPAAVGLTDFQIATTTFVIDPLDPVGTVIQFAWRTTPTTQSLDWFGVTNAPGASITVVPEPATAALLVAGLLGLGLCSPRTRRAARAANASKVAALSIIAVAGVVGPSLSASATTNVRLVASGPFTPGSIITLQTFVTSNGGEVDNTVFGAINYPDATVNTNLVGNSQVNLSTVGTAAPGWILNGLVCSTLFCSAFGQLNPLGATQVGLTDFQIATTTFVIDPLDSVGTVIQFSWRTTPTTQGLDWFGVTNAPGVSITVVPEPTTAALLAIGLLGLTLARRR